jgi:hypothetical protein
MRRLGIQKRFALSFSGFLLSVFALIPPATAFGGA